MGLVSVHQIGLYWFFTGSDPVIKSYLAWKTVLAEWKKLIIFQTLTDSMDTHKTHVYYNYVTIIQVQARQHQDILALKWGMI